MACGALAVMNRYRFPPQGVVFGSKSLRALLGLISQRSKNADFTTRAWNPQDGVERPNHQARIQL
eukprot:2741471-Pleurochrysis_carterae.AAC.1